MREIKIGDTNYPVKFGLGALKKLMGKYKLKKLVEAEALMNNIEIEDMPMILELGISNGCKILSEDPPTRENIEEAFDADLGLMQATLDIFSKDMSGEEEVKEEVTKKVMYKE